MLFRFCLDLKCSDPGPKRLDALDLHFWDQSVLTLLGPKHLRSEVTMFAYSYSTIQTSKFYCITQYQFLHNRRMLQNWTFGPAVTVNRSPTLGPWDTAINKTQWQQKLLHVYLGLSSNVPNLIISLVKLGSSLAHRNFWRTVADQLAHTFLLKTAFQPVHWRKICRRLLNQRRISKNNVKIRSFTTR